MNIQEMTGLEIMQAFARGEIPAPSICETIPMQPVEVEYGRAVFLHKRINATPIL